MNMELDETLYEKIILLSEEGNDEFDNENYENALNFYIKALNVLPKPHYDWEAGTWIYTSIGDTYFMMNQYEEALDYFMEALKCPEGIGNPYILLRIGECFFEIGNINKAVEYLLQSYMIEGYTIFEEEPKKYYKCIKKMI